MTKPSIRSATAVMRDALRTQLWPLPTIGIFLAVALGVTLPRVDGHVDRELPASLVIILFGGGADAARAVLVAIAGSLITVTSLTFSLTVVTLQLASSQFSPRLLRTFTRDRFVHVTLALFLATFAYALTVLRTVRTADAGQQAFVPQASVTVAFLLTLTSVLFLVLFLAHLARKIRVETMLRDVHTDATATAQRVLTDPANDQAPAPELPAPPSTAVAVCAANSGFLSRIDEDALLTAAVDADAVVLIDRRPGGSLVAGTPIGLTWPRIAESFLPKVRTRLVARVTSAVSTQFERTSAQDAEFGLRQLTDVAVKALSPGINDPTTAIHALGHSAALLCSLAGRALEDRVLLDRQDRIRVVLRRPDLDALLDLAVSQPRRYGAADPAVLARLMTLLREIAWTVHRPDHRRAVTRQLNRLRATIEAQDFDATELEQLAHLADGVRHALSGRWISS
ncbi:DUF2254 domain-containing protein [Amycolatopsis sp. NPDC051758]|uniref:DUF2254 domain-containing protein n=1 Tax=Amycolatopsis sp. NPDC051758 TaxID=3363935 RepID=UPI00379D9EC1